VVALAMGWASGNWKKLCTNAVASEWIPVLSVKSCARSEQQLARPMTLECHVDVVEPGTSQTAALGDLDRKALAGDRRTDA
jgi:hypothetical protein